MRKTTGIAAVLCFILGLTFLLYNPVFGWLTQAQMRASIAKFEQGKAHIQGLPGTESAAEKNYSGLLTDMQKYNRTLYESGQIGLSDAWSYEQPAFDLDKYGLAADAVAVLHIPVMEQEFPVYLGATKENLAKGVAVLGQTSMPVSGTNTNCVIAGHRGYSGTAFFREIERLQPGDFIYLTTYWEERVYQVESTAIILPNDIEAVLIQDGKELLTLITCHPYTVSTHRYVVYCTAVKGTASKEEFPDGIREFYVANPDPSPQAQKPSASSQSRILLEQWLPFLAIPLIILSAIILIWPFKKKKAVGKEGMTNHEKNVP